jgi:hypothetical protein
MQIPFSLQSPQNILNGENLNGKQSKQQKDRYFGAVSGNDAPFSEKEKKNHVAEQKGIDQKDVEKKIDMLKKLYYEDKLLSPRTYERKMQALTSKS